MAVYVRTSIHLQRITLQRDVHGAAQALPHHQVMLNWFLPAFQESTSLKELNINFPLVSGPSNLALGNMLTHTQSLRSLSLRLPPGLEDITVAAIQSGLKKNITLRELTLDVWRGAATVSHFDQSARPSSPCVGMGLSLIPLCRCRRRGW